jgi:hypothetical protein
MPRPTTTPIAADQAGWDATIDDNFDVLVGGPFPIKEYANFAALPAAGADNARCVAALTDEHRLVISTGAAWLRLPSMAAAQADSVAADVATIVADFNALLAKLRATKVIDT